MFLQKLKSLFMCFFLLFVFTRVQERSFANVQNYEREQDFEQNLSRRKRFNPYKNFLYFRHSFLDKEILTFKTNDLCFTNSLGTYKLWFVFYKDNSKIRKEQAAEMFLEIHMHKPIVPYYTYLQQLKMTIKGVENKLTWVTNINFSTREAEQTVDKKVKLSISKKITISDQDILRRIFQLSRKVLFFVEGFEGNFDCIIEGEARYFYSEFFDYSKKIGFY